MRALLFSASSKKCLLPWTTTQTQVQRRNLIFTDAYLNIDILRERRNEKRAARGDGANGHFLRAARKDFEANGVRNMLVTDAYQGRNSTEICPRTCPKSCLTFLRHVCPSTGVFPKLVLVDLHQKFLMTIELHPR